MIQEIAAAAGVRFFDYQRDALAEAQSQIGTVPRLCLYFKTGAGKSLTALACMKVWDVDDVLVIAPPSTKAAWEEQARKLGIAIEVMSHAKFRMKGTQLSRSRAIIADEFHLFGGHKGQGWKKMDRLAASLQAPLVLASATPNYNDADRVYCIQHVLSPETCRGGYLEFVYRHCRTSQNPFGREPIVEGFLNFDSAAEYLSSLPKVCYVPDDLEYEIYDMRIDVDIPDELETFMYNRRRHKMVASIIELSHAKVDHALIADDGRLNPDVYEELAYLAGQAPTPVLVYANHSTVAEALAKSLVDNDVQFGLVTGKTSTKAKAAEIARFNRGELDLLVGTASLATGTDGMDKVCDALIILDDTDDDSLRRQLVGRIMPRGEGGDPSKKHVWRLTWI